MKTTELIKKLQKAVDENGDLKCILSDEDRITNIPLDIVVEHNYITIKIRNRMVSEIEDK